MEVRRSSCPPLLTRKEQFVAIGIGDPDHVVAPPRFLGRHRALRDLTAKLIEPVPGQLHEQTAFVPPRGILTQDDFALPTVDLADFPLAVGFMPSFFEPQLVDVKTEGAPERRTRRTQAARTSDEGSAR